MFYFLCLFLVLAGCEDKKKPSKAIEEIENTRKTEEEKTDQPEIKNETIPKKSKTKHPVLTSENVKDFLTAYGKENPETKVLIETSKGNMEIELFKDTPLHRANFIFLVKEGYFDETFFHRVVPEFIIQAGNSDLQATQDKRSAIGKDYLLPAEIIPGRIHEYGTVSGAKQYRSNPDHRTAPFEFYIFLGPKSSASHLNGFYTIFGKVTKGMDVVEKISELEADNEEWPLDNIYIKAKVLN